MNKYRIKGEGESCNLEYGPTKDVGIIRPVRGRGEPVVGPDAVMVMVPSELTFLVRKTQAKRIPLRDAALPCIFQPEVPWKSISLSGPFLGAPQAVMAMEKLVALGATRFWILGWCGSLQEDLRIGDVAIPTGAVSEEGTSNHYPIKDQEVGPEPMLTECLMDALMKSGMPFRSGRIWTTDAPYRETPEKVLRYQREGVLAVELFDLTWSRGFSNPKLRKATRSGAEILLRVAQSSGSLIKEKKENP